MEKVQRRATKMVYGFGNLKYEERLERLNLFLLQYRRMRGDMIEPYKIISGLEDVNSSQFFASMDNLCGYNLKVYTEHLRKVIHEEIFLMVINQRNGLSEEVVKAKTLNSFKNSLEKYWRIYKH